MSELVHNLEDNLKRQVALYDELHSLEEHKQKAIMKSKLQELEAITVREEQLLMKAGSLEKERLLWAEKIGIELGKPPEDLTLAELAEHYPVLQEVRLDLDRVIRALQGIHEINTQLLQQAMKVVEFTVGLLTHQEKSTYQRPTQLKDEGQQPKLHFLDRRI